MHYVFYLKLKMHAPKNIKMGYVNFILSRHIYKCSKNMQKMPRQTKVVYENQSNNILIIIFIRKILIKIQYACVQKVEMKWNVAIQI